MGHGSSIVKGGLEEVTGTVDKPRIGWSEWVLLMMDSHRGQLLCRNLESQGYGQGRGIRVTIYLMWEGGVREAGGDQGKPDV